MQRITYYPIGTPGKKWGNTDKAQWLALQTIKRSYTTDVVSQVNALGGQFDIINYGNVSYENADYPLYAIKTKNWDSNKPTALITGGVHGYETSGVHGALRFASTKALAYAQDFNLVIALCISPWAYETINRWNPATIDPNRSFYANSPAPESAALMALVSEFDFLVHIDLHETTDSDNSEFRPALAARDAIEQKSWEIPDGFYAVGDTENPCHDFQAAVITAVKQVTHIAPSDSQGMIIGVPVTQQGVINYELNKLGLCASVTNAKYTTTTEVYPDSPHSDSENCILAQVAAICGALDYVQAHG
jgi:hypothetical protein